MRTYGNASPSGAHVVVDQLRIETIVGSIKLPSKPAPPRFDKPVPEHAKQLPPKLRIDANFEGVSNMKVNILINF